MTDSRPEGTLQALWQSQPLQQRAVSIDEVRARARYLERRVARRNRREYLAAVVVLLAYATILWFAPVAAVRIGAGLIIVATIFLCYRLRTYGSATPLERNAGMHTSVEFYRAQLERQRDLLRSVWRWALLPFVPGALVALVGLARARPELTSRLVVYGVASLALMVGLHALNRRAAGRIQRELDRFNESVGR